MVIEKKEITFSDVALQYRTGRAYTISGAGRDRVPGYRSGVKCALGDIEESEWCELVRKLIQDAGEQELHRQLSEFVREEYPWCRSKKEVEREALDLHARRIFDNESWVLFVRFNQRYRPEFLVGSHLKQIVTDCCEKPGLVTLTMIEKASGSHTIPCPICGKRSAFRFDNSSEEEKKCLQ